MTTHTITTLVEVDTGCGGVSIHHALYGELIYWDEQEWIDEPDLVLTIADTISLAYTDPDKLVSILRPHYIQVLRGEA